MCDHSSFEQDRVTMTKRFLTAVENPAVNIIGHPVTRKVGRRPPPAGRRRPGRAVRGLRPHRDGA
jgi:histidinol phosphatase-like PHP family hydrolase